MGTTQLHSFIQSVSGKVFFESFESPSWLADEAWTIVQGNPVNSPNAAFDGLKSFIVDSSLPVIKKTFPASPAVGWIVVYFFDDATQTAQTFSPFFKVTDGSANTFGIGVRNPTSTGFYSLFFNGVYSASAVARASGWHRFTFRFDGVNTWHNSIDGTTVANIGAATPATFIQLGFDSGTGTPFGFFDFIQAGINNFLTVVGLTNGQNVSLFTSADVQVDSTQTAAGGQVQINVSTQDSPFDGYVVATAPDGTRSFFRSDINSLFAGDTWTQRIYDFGRKATSFSSQPSVHREAKESNSGKQESIFFSARQNVTINVTDLTRDQKDALLAWWRDAHNQKSFGVTVDSADCFFTKMANGPVFGAQNVVSVQSTKGLGQGQRVIITTVDNFSSENHKVASVVGSTSFQVDSPLLFTYQTGDIVRSRYYLPAVLVNESALSVSLINVKLDRWNVSISTKEQL